MGTPALQFLEGIISNQAAMQSAQTDVYALLTRYIFNPFSDRELTLQQQQDYGIPSLDAGYIIPFRRFNKQDMDYREILDVPHTDGVFHPTAEGVSRVGLFERRPGEVVNSILEVFNRHHGTNPVQDNGICEIEALRGNEDFALLLDLNAFCLPTKYGTAREQIAQLERAVEEARTGKAKIYHTVAGRMLRSTVQAKAWAHWHYENLESQMEDREHSGKRNLSPLDTAVCKWIEKPPPRFRSNLSSEATPVIIQGQTASTPTIQCFDCGALANLLPDGSQPKKGCLTCGSKTFGRDEELVIEDKPKRGRPAKQQVGDDPLM